MSLFNELIARGDNILVKCQSREEGIWLLKSLPHNVFEKRVIEREIKDNNEWNATQPRNFRIEQMRVCGVQSNDSYEHGYFAQRCGHPAPYFCFEFITEDRISNLTFDNIGDLL